MDWQKRKEKAVTKILWRWEQDGSGGEHGAATYFIDPPNEIKVQMPNFQAAQQLHTAIAQAINEARWDARKLLLNQITRIQP